jgi:hypothetical protein
MASSTVCKEIDRLNQAVDDVLALDPFTLSGPETMIAVDRLSSRIEYLKTKVVAEFATGGGWTMDGAKTPAAWLVSACHLPRPEALRLVRRSLAVPGLPVAAEAFAQGEIGPEQFDVLAKACTPVTEEAMAKDEDLLVGYATRMKFASFCAVLAYWAEEADPEGAERSELERKAKRNVTLVPKQNGTFFGKMLLDAESGTIVSAELKRLEDGLFEEDWAEATARLGRKPKLAELVRTPAQRGADALVEMALRSASTPAGAQRPEPRLVFLVGYEAIYGRICRIEGGPVVTPGSVLAHLDGAEFERIVFAPGKRIECSPRTRFFTGATRRAIEVRDQECTHEYCDLAAARCQMDHIVPHSDGGLTEQENAQVLCGFHNRLRNHGPPGAGDHGPEPGDGDSDDCDCESGDCESTDCESGDCESGDCESSDHGPEPGE